MQDSPNSSPFLLSAATLSTIVRHELNNIAMTMQGFVELTSESAALSKPVRQCFEELRIGIARISALAFQLESLASEQATAQGISISKCVQNAEWRCDPSTTVVVDTYHAQAAIEALTQLGEKSRGSDAASVLVVNQDVAGPTDCAVCGASLPRTDRYLRLQIREAKVSRKYSLRDWDQFEIADNTTRRLTLAVLAHSAHLAGGHVIIDDRSHLVGLVFPTM